MSTLIELKELTDRLDYASRLYYNGITSEFSDTQFDLQMHRLKEMEVELCCVFPNSPTLRVGSDIQEGFKKINHPSPMLTIENVYSMEELESWLSKIVKTYGVKLFNCSVKYDGVSCELHYVNGIFASASTRGDKIVGDDITENVRTIKNIPFVIPQLNEIPDAYIRGEVLMRKSMLDKLNEEREAKGEDIFANTRNACSGSIKQFDPKITASRNLIFKAWDILSDDEKLIATFNNSMQGKYLALSNMGFYYEPGTIPIDVDADNLINIVQNFYDRIKSLNLDYDFDGIVIKIDDLAVQNSIGTKDTRAIEWGIARKWNEEYESKTILNGIDWQVGRTGIVTPVAKLEPVECSGVLVKNATLHNVEVVRENDIHIGNYIDIVRSGGVIPYVTKIYHDLVMEASGAYPKAEIPMYCPECREPLIQDGKFLKCVNADCFGRMKGILLQFTAKDACNIKSIGPSTIKDLYKSGIVKNLSDFIRLADHWAHGRKDHIEAMILANKLGIGYGIKSVVNMLDEMEFALNNTPLDKLLCALSIPGVGKVTGRNIANRFKSLARLKTASVEEIKDIDGIGDIMSEDIYKWIKENESIFDLLESTGWQTRIESNEIPEGGDALKGMTLCFTGKSYRFNGDDVEAFLEGNGAKCTHSVSKTMSYLITGEKPGGSKIDKAKNYGVEIISEKDFYNKFSI